MTKVTLFEADEWEPYELKLGKGSEILKIKAPLTKKTSAKARDCEVVAVFITSKVDKTVLDALPKLKLVAAMSVGVDHIDVAECQRKGIIVSNVPGYGEATVAEHAFGLLLAACRKLPQSFDRTKKGDFDRKSLRGTELRGKTIAIIGTGRIGSAVAGIAVGFGMKVLLYDNHCRPELRNVGEYVLSLDEILSRSDAISLHLPLTPKTRHLLNQKTLAKVKKGAILINTARGELVESDALLEALDSGRLAAAGLDVVEGSPKELLKHPRVYLTPHNAFNTEEAVQRILKTTAENITAFLAGRPQNVAKA